MKKSILTARWACLLPVMGLLAIASSASAAVTLTPAVIFNVGTNRFTYTYSVMNAGTPDPLIQVTFPVSPSAALMGIIAPAGFKITYDTVGARVNFLQDDSDLTTQSFAPGSTVPGFSFNSPVGPGAVQFVASDEFMDFTDTTSAPIPEPSVLVLGLAAVPALLRRRRA